MEIIGNKLLTTALAFTALIGACTLLAVFYASQAERTGPAAEWDRTFDNGFYDYGSSVLQTADGGFIITGGSSPALKGDRDALLLKTDGNGSMQWQKLYGGSGFDYGYAVAEAAGGGYAMAGVTQSRGDGSGDVYLVRTDPAGNVAWEKTFGGSGFDEGRALLQTPDGGFLIAGATGTRDNGSDIYLVRTDADGNGVLERTYGGAYDDLAISIQPTRDGGYVIGGRYGTGNGTGDGYLIKVDAWGLPEWDRRLPGKDRVVYQVRQTEDRGYIAVGHTNFLSGTSEVILTRIDHEGQPQWDKVFRSDGTMKGYNVFGAPDGGFLIVGEDRPGARYQGMLLKTDADGNQQYRQTYGAPRDVFIRAGTPTTDGGMALAGSIGDREDVETWDVYLLKTGRP